MKVEIGMMCPQAKGHLRLLEAGKGKKATSPLEPPVRNANQPIIQSREISDFYTVDL